MERLFARRGSGSRIGGRALGLTVAAGVLLSLALPAGAGAYVYWGNEDGSTVGRAELDGSGVNQSFITSTPDSGPCGIAVNDTHIFWANYDQGTTIGRANLDGSNANPSFITGADDPCGVAVNDTHVFWANYSADTIGRANLDGSAPNQSFIATSEPCGLAIDDTHIFWGSYLQDNIGRAELANPAGANGSFITGGDYTCGVAVNDTHVFWANEDGGVLGNGSIGRANIDGSAPDQEFITVVTGPETCGVAVNQTHIYWGDDDGTDIGRANLDGTNPSPSLITGAAAPCGLAVDELPDRTPPETTITKGPKKKTKKKKATFEFTSSEPGSSFECSRDDKAFKPCTSPHKVKVKKKGRHTLEVRAIDEAGNVDPAPASRSWKYKKKKKR